MLDALEEAAEEQKARAFEAELGRPRVKRRR